MALREYGSYDAVGLADLVRRKQVSAKELLDEAIARTAKVDGEINAVVVKHYDYAERQIDNGLPEGPFTGVPFLLKDLDILEGTRTTSGASVRPAPAMLSRKIRRDTSIVIHSLPPVSASGSTPRTRRPRRRRRPVPDGERPGLLQGSRS